jgi:hypothetical protein
MKISNPSSFSSVFSNCTKIGRLAYI